MSFKNNSPTFSYISWNSCYITYDGIDYIIEDGYTCMKYVYWDYNNPYKFIVSNLLQDETITKQLVAVNDRGMVSTVELDNITLTFTENSSDGISGQITSGLVALYDKQQNDSGDYSEKFATLEVTLDEISTLMGELEATDDGLSERISSLQQTAEGISMEVSNVQKEYSKDKEHMVLRDEIGEALIMFNSELGLFTSDLNEIMKDNSLSATEKTTLTTRMNNLTKYKNNIDTIISKIVSKISSESGNVIPLQEEKVAFGNAFSNLMTTYNTVVSDNSFTTAEMTSITNVIGTMNTKCITLGNVLEEIILLPFNGKLIEELSKLSIKSNEILLGVYENEKSAELNSEKIAELRVTADGISSHVSKVETNLSELGSDLQGNIDELGSDLHNNYPTTIRMNSAIEQTASEIKSTVSSVQSSVNTNKNNINNLTTRMSNAEQKITADAIINTVSSTYTTKAEFNNLTIGATNLIKDGDCTDLKNYSVNNPGSVTAYKTENGTHKDSFHIYETTATNSKWTGVSQVFEINPTIGQQYTASMYYYAEKNPTIDDVIGIEIKGFDEDGNDVFIGGTSVDPNEIKYQTWTRISLTTTINKNYSRIYVTAWLRKNGSVFVDRIQVEKGNKLTEWHASPKDLEGTISTIEERVSKAEQKITSDAIINTVSSVYTTKEEINNLSTSNTNLLKGSIDYSGNGWTNEGYCTITNSTYKGSKIYTTSYAWRDIGYRILDLFERNVVEVGVYYTFSAYVRSSSVSYSPKVFFYGDEISPLRIDCGTIDTSWKRVSGTFKWTYKPTNDTALRFEAITDAPSGVTLQVCGIKLERGDKASEWTPAPEDVQGQVDITNTNLTNLTTRVNTAEQKITADAIVSTVTSSSSWTTQASNITKAQNSANTAQNTANTNKTNISALATRVSTAEQKITADAITSTVTSSQSWKNQTDNITNAQNTANTAKNTANTANNTANSVKSNISALETRVSTAEQKITSDAITNTVTNSTSWKNQTTNITNAQNTANTANNTANTNKSNISALTNRVSTAESKITATAIVNTVTSSSNWKTQTTSITNAQNTANTANSTANSALSKANTNASNITTVQSSVTQLSNRISWMVKSGDSQSTMTLTDKMYSLISSNITLTASRINLHGYVTANGGFSINSSGTATMTGAKIIGSGSGNRILINNADYEVQTGGTTKVFFGLRQLEDTQEIPRLAMGPWGLNKNSNSYFVTTAYPSNNNPLNNGQNYIDLAYRTQNYWTTDTSGDVSNIRMLDDGDIHIAPVRNLLIKSSYKDGVHNGSSDEQTIAEFRTSGWSEINNYLKVDAVIREEGTSKGLVLGTRNTAGNYALVRVTIDSDNYRFFAPLYGDNNVSLGSPSYLWSRVCAVNGTINTSDRRLKENVQYIHETPNPKTIKSVEYTLQDMYDFVKDDLAMTTYTMKDDKEQKLKYGFIAQDIIDTKVGYNIISQDNEGNFLGYDTMNYTSALAGALKQSINEIEKLKEEINILKNEITELKK